jgi:peptide deformylase
VAVRPIRLLGDPVLRTPCAPVERFDDALRALVADLVDTVRFPGRAGLAAPQLGVAVAVFVYDVDGRLGCVVNPRVVAASGSAVGREGCLSVPGPTVRMARATEVVVTGVGVAGRPVTVEGTGELARCLLHETDHLDGVLYLDRLEGVAQAGCPASRSWTSENCNGRSSGDPDTAIGSSRNPT